MGESWIVAGATDYDYQLTHVSVMPYTEEMAAVLGAKVNRSCQGSFYRHSAWKPFNRYDIFSYVEFHDHRLADYEDDAYVVVDQDCTHAIDFSLHELQLIRVESRTQGHQTGLTRSLLLGDIHTDRKQRAYHRPTTFQEPLFPPEVSTYKLSINSDQTADAAGLGEAKIIISICAECVLWGALINVWLEAQKRTS